MNEYKKLIEILNELSSKNPLEDFYLNEGLIEKIFGKSDETIGYCKVSNEITYFTIVLNFTYKDINRYKIINLKTTEYKFSYKNNLYYCFEMESMKKYLNDLLLEHEYYIEITSLPYAGKKIKDIEQFLMLDYSNFNILISYQFKDIDYNKFDYNSIYSLPDVITGKNLNLKLGHYVSLTEEEFNDFVYYDTEERKKFYKGFKRILGFKKVIGFCGPYGTGKTIMMLKMIISDKSKKYLYINLGTVNELNDKELKKLLKYEIIKLFDPKIIFLKDNKLEEKIAYNKIINLIDNMKDKQIFPLVKNIILEMNKLKYIDSYFIIDQYSSKYDIENNMIKELINANKNSHIIVCSSMNNESVKNHLYQCLNEKTVFPSYSIDFIYYFYVGSLIRLNSLLNYEDIINKKSQEFVKYLNFFGNVPLYYYLLERTEAERGELDDFINKEKITIINEIKLYYKGNKRNKYDESFQIIIDILNIMSFINKKEIFFFDELSEIVLKLPLKFLEIKKETIKFNDLKLFGLASNNKKLNNYIKEIEEQNSLQKIKDNQYILQNYTIFFNEDKYCINYISRLTKKEKKQLGFNDTNIEEEITIFYLDYLFPLMEEIFSNITYETLKISSMYLYQQLPAQSQGGLLELIISEYVKNKKLFLLYNISYCETIDNFVSNEFFIQNFSTRKTNTLRTFIENKNKKSYKKKKLTDGNIFFTQLQFTGKYYDCALLVPCKDSSGYVLMVLQISKRKITYNRFFREDI